MGMANKPPSPSYKRTFHVVSHASNERYRERFRGTSAGHLDEDHLANYIDAAVVDARRRQLGIPITDTMDGAPGEIVPIDEGKNLWALLKPNNQRQLSKRFPFAIVTVLLQHQVTRSLNSGRWLRKGQTTRTESQAFTLPVAQLAKLEAMRKDVITMAQEEKASALIKLEFRDGSGCAVHKDCASIQEAEELINNPQHGLSYVRAWVPAQTKQKIVLE